MVEQIKQTITVRDIDAGLWKRVRMESLAAGVTVSEYMQTVFLAHWGEGSGGGKKKLKPAQVEPEAEINKLVVAIPEVQQKAIVKQYEREEELPDEDPTNEMVVPELCMKQAGANVALRCHRVKGHEGKCSAEVSRG